MPLFYIPPPPSSKLNFQDWVDKGYQSNNMKPEPTQCPICGSSDTTCKGESNGSSQARTQPPAAEPADPDPAGAGDQAS